MRERWQIRIPAAFSPTIAFPALWLLGVGLAQIHILRIQSNWSAMAWIVMGFVPVAFVAGARLGDAVIRARPVLLDRLFRSEVRPPRVTRTFRIVVLALLALGCLEAAHQFAAAGSVPLFSSHIDQSRTGLPGGPTMIFSNGLTLAVVAALTVPRHLLARESILELGVAVSGLAVITSFGGRGAILLPLAVVVMVRWMTWGRPPVAVLAAGGVGVVGLLAVFFFARTAQLPIDNFDAELYQSVVPSTPDVLRPFLPVHFAIALNFEVLAHLVDYFPASQPFGHGVFNSGALDRVLPTEALPTRQLTQPWLVSTAAGPLWADGGLVWVTGGFLVIGLVAGASEALAKVTKMFPSALLFAYVLYLTLFCLYDNLWTHYIDWVVIAPGLVLVGAVATRGGDGAGSPKRPARPPRDGGYPCARLALLLDRSTPRQRTAVGVAAVVALFVMLVAIVVSVSDVGVKRAGPGGGAPPLPVTSVLPLPESVQRQLSAGSAKDAVVISDGDLQNDNQPLWVVTRTPKPAVYRVRRVSESRLAERRFDLPAAPAATEYDVARWSEASDAIFQFSRAGSDIAVRGYKVGPRPRLAIRTRVTLPPPPSGMTRDIAMATWSGPRPDLFVIDRGAPIDRVAVRVLSGESRFSQAIVTTRAAIRGADRTRWTVDVARSGGAKPNLVLISREGSHKRTEVHILRGDTSFQSFAVEAETALGSTRRAGIQFAMGTSFGVPTLYAIAERRSGARLGLIPLRGSAPVGIQGTG